MPQLMKTRFQSILAFLLYAVVSLLKLTYRFKFFGVEARHAAEAYHPKGSLAVALWHEHLFGAILAHAGQPFCPMTSPSLDGDFVTYVMEKWGFKPIRGSTSRRGREARTEMVEALSNGFYTAVTVDGPKGPRRVVRGGVIDVAEHAGTAILPLAVASSRAWVLKSWDQFKLPKPFCKIALRYGEPIFLKDYVDSKVSEKYSLKDLKKLLAERLNETEKNVLKDLEQWTR